MCEYCNKKITVCNRAYKALLRLGSEKQVSSLETVTIPKQQYEEMQKKIKLFDNQHYLRQHKTRF